MESSREVKADVSGDVAKLCTVQPLTESGVREMGTTPALSVFAQELEDALDPENGIEEEYMPYRSAVCGVERI